MIVVDSGRQVLAPMTTDAAMMVAKWVGWAVERGKKSQKWTQLFRVVSRDGTRSTST